MMSLQRFRILLEGALAAWQVDAVLTFESSAPGCRIDCADGATVTISVDKQAFGPVWRIAESGRRERVHASIVPALRGLRAVLRPDRAAARVLFVSDVQAGASR